MPKETCIFEPQFASAYCKNIQKNEPCLLFLSCSALNNNNNGDLTPIQFHKLHPKLKIDQIVEIIMGMKEIDKQDEAPLRTLDGMVLKKSFVISDTDICVLEGMHGRRKKCPNNPTKEPKDQHMPPVCVTCFSFPEVAQ